MEQDCSPARELFDSRSELASPRVSRYGQHFSAAPVPLKPTTLKDAVRAELVNVRVAGRRPSLRLYPDFLIIGPQRTGTTWLHHNLKVHPSIFLPRDKELYYFNKVGLHDSAGRGFEYLEDYLEAFRDSPRIWLKKTYDCIRKSKRLYYPTRRGEATASYAGLDPEIIREVCLLNPELKAVLMVRDPIDRTWSHARKDLLRDGVDPESVTHDDLARFFRAAGQRKLGSYGQLIENWHVRLQPRHLFVGDFRAIAQDPKAILSAIHTFLGVPTGERYFGAHLKERINPATVAAIPTQAMEYLRNLLAEEIEEFESICERFAGKPGIRI